MKKKILHISHLYPNQKGPYLGPFMGELNESLLDDYEVQFLVPTPKSIPFTKKWELSRSSFIHNNAKRIFYLSIPRRKAPAITQKSLQKAIFKHIETENPDLIHVHWAYPEILLFPDIKKFKKPTVLTFHGHIFYSVYANKILRSYLENAIKNADKIFVVGKKLKEDIANRYPKQAHKTEHIANGINKTKFTLGDKTKAQNKVGFSHDKTNILCVANIANQKGTHVLIDAIAESKLLQSYDFHIIGRTIEKEVEQYVKTRIREESLTNVFLYGPKPHHELINYYQAADLFVLPSLVEGFGVVLVEAGMCGLPLVSTRSGGPQDIITEKIGKLADVNNAADLRRKLEQTISDLDQYEPNYIRNYMIDNFSQDTITSIIKNNYDELIREYSNSK